MSGWKDGLDERSILIIENLIWAYENCNIADNKLIRDFIDCGINHIKTQAKENAELIEKIDKLESESARLKAERDAAVEEKVGICNDYKQETNYDKIKAMSIEEMGEFLSGAYFDGFNDRIKAKVEPYKYTVEWLNEPSEQTIEGR